MIDARQHDATAFDPEFDGLPGKGPGQDVPTNRLAVVSLIAGIVGFFVPVVGPVTAIVTGHVARGEIRRSRGRLGGEGLATSGLILGYMWIGLMLLAIIAMVSAYDAREEAIRGAVVSPAPVRIVEPQEPFLPMIEAGPGSGMKAGDEAPGSFSGFGRGGGIEAIEPPAPPPMPPPPTGF